MQFISRDKLPISTITSDLEKITLQYLFLKNTDQNWRRYTVKNSVKLTGNFIKFTVENLSKKVSVNLIEKFCWN